MSCARRKPPEIGLQLVCGRKVLVLANYQLEPPTPLANALVLWDPRCLGLQLGLHDWFAANPVGLHDWFAANEVGLHG